MHTIKITLKDLRFLMECEERAQTSKKIGYTGADKTAKELVAALNATVEVSADAVESALFSFYQLQENGYSVSHPDGISRETFIKRITPKGYAFDFDLGCFYRNRR